MTQPRITKIYLENFQAISGPVEIEFGDLTFLYGPNSAGKSAIFDAIGCFREWLVDGFTETKNPWDEARIVRKGSQNFRDNNIAVGIEIQVNEANVNTVYGAYEHIDPQYLSPEEDYSVEQAVLDVLRSGAKIDLRLVFKDPPDMTIELRINHDDPLLVINNTEEEVLNFFSSLKQYLPPEYVKKTQQPKPSNHPFQAFMDSVKSDQQNLEEWNEEEYWGEWFELHDLLKTTGDYFNYAEAMEPAMLVAGGCCRIDLRQPLGRALLWEQKSTDTLQDKYIKEVLDEKATFRGIEWSHFPSEKNRRVKFATTNDKFIGARVALGGKDLGEATKLTPDAPEIFVRSPRELQHEGEKFAKKLSDLFNFLSKLYIFALHSAHVLGNRSIIDSSEPIHLSQPFDHPDFDPQQDFYPQFFGGGIPEISLNPLQHRANAATSYLGYEHAAASYADRIASLSLPDEDNNNGWTQDINGKWIPPKLWEDFPNSALKKLLPSLSRYRIKRLPYVIYQHWTNEKHDQVGELNGGSLVYFQAYDRYFDKNINFSDLGSGLSFVFPILISLSESEISFIEQPELHLHPRAQAEIADLLIAAKNRKNFSIVESHSEQIIMRVSKRILETTNSLLNKSVNVQSIRPELEIRPEDVRIYYFDPSSNPYEGTQITEINFAADGSLIDDWPEGFFEKDDVNSFSRLQLFSKKANLSNARERWPWINEFKDNPDIMIWLTCASAATLIEDMYAVVFPLYASKIAEKLIVEKLLNPFRENFTSLKGDQRSCPDPTLNYLYGSRRAPTLGQFVNFLNEVQRPFKSSEDSHITEFRNFLKTRPWEGKNLLRNQNFIDRLKKLSDVRNGGAHIKDSQLSEALKIQDILVDGDKPGPLLRAFGYNF